MTREQIDVLHRTCRAAGVPTDGAEQYMRSCLAAGKLLYGVPDVAPILPATGRSGPENGKERRRVLAIMERLFCLFVIVLAIAEAQADG